MYARMVTYTGCWDGQWATTSTTNIPRRRWERSSTCSIPPTYGEPRHQIPRRRRRRVVEAQETRKGAARTEEAETRSPRQPMVAMAANISWNCDVMSHFAWEVLTLPRTRWYDRFYKAVRIVEETISFVTLCQLLNQQPTHAGPTHANTIISYRKSCKLSKEHWIAVLQSCKLFQTKKINHKDNNIYIIQNLSRNKFT